MRSSSSARGFSLAETLIAAALIASATAAMLPAIAQASRLQRDSDLQTAAVLMSVARLERLESAVAAGLGAGGSLDAPVDGWYAWLDRDGRAVQEADAAFACRWAAAPSAVPGVLIAAVRVAPRAAPHAAITLSTAVRHE
jgi:hypothetical protein